MARRKTRTLEERKQYEKEWRAANRDKMRQYAKKYREAHRDMPQHLMRKYGITVKRKEEMWDEQKGLCAVCGTPMISVFNRDCCVDHDHKTNKVRGLVHWYCNIIVGVFEAKPVLFEQVQSYIRDAIVRTQENENLESLAEMTKPMQVTS